VIREISPHDAKSRLHAGGEIAFLDVREAGEFGEAHPLFAVPCPYSRLEIVVGALVPNRCVEVILIDGGDGVAARAARCMEGLGYEHVSVVAGGAPGWAAAGLTLYKGVNVPSKTLGELAEAVWHPATIDAATLQSWRDDGRPFRLFDARPPAEYTKMRVPGAACLPNGELAHRFGAAVPDPDVPVVLNCAGRTRGLIGAIGLKLAGIGNPVLALENGTQGWALENFALERGAAPEPYPALNDEALDASRRRAHAISEKWRIPWIDAVRLATLRDDPGRSLYLFDVRSAEEFAAGHLPGAVHAPGGQLVQASDQWIGIRRARLVLSDDTGLRAALAAFWLRQLGWETYVLAAPGLFTETASAEAGSAGTALPSVSAADAAAGLAAGTHRLLDLRPSQAYRSGHPAGAEWTIRPRVAAQAAGLESTVLLAEEPAVAALAAVDLKESGVQDIRLLEGGFAAWRDAGLPVESTPNSPTPAEAIDFLAFVHDRHDGNLDASRRYLAWEQGLVAQLDPEERGEFRLERPPA
jgi:rhodanese-related sulfurtransferase